MVTLVDMASEICVLYVDDNPALRDLSAELLERVSPGIVVRTEAEPTAVLDRLSQESIDCVVSDLEMPDIDGIQLCELIRQKHPQVPYFLFTNTDDPSIIDKALAAGATDYVQKSTGTEHYTLIANRISNAVHHRRTRDRLAELESRV